MLEDISSHVLEEATAWIRQSFDEGVLRGKVEAGVRDKALSLLSTATDLQDAIRALIGNEAFHMLRAGGATAEDIDKALKLGLHHPMGPFEPVDLVGLDVRFDILEYLQEHTRRKIPTERTVAAIRERGPAGEKNRPRSLRVSPGGSG